MWLSVVTGIVALSLAALTDHNTGLIRIIPYWLHLWVDRAVGVVFLIAPFAFKFTGLDAWYYWINAGAILLVTSVLKHLRGHGPLARTGQTHDGPSLRKVRTRSFDANATDRRQNRIAA